MISTSLRYYHRRIIHHMINMGYVWNANDQKETFFFHQLYNFLDSTVNRFLMHLDHIKFFNNLFLHKNITYYLVCLTLYTTVDIHQLLDDLDKSLLYRLMAKNNCNLLKRRIFYRLKHIIREFVV
jgi:hypothetical protein